MEASMRHQAAVSASSSSAAEAGISILRQGGNAVDAAVMHVVSSRPSDRDFQKRRSDRDNARSTPRGGRWYAKSMRNVLARA